MPRKKKNAPLMPMKPKRPRVKAHSSSRWPRIAAILERTRAARAQLDELAKGADLSAYDHLPVMVKGPKRSRACAWRVAVKTGKQIKTARAAEMSSAPPSF